MKKIISNFFNYIATMWSGLDGKPSLSRVLALAIGIDLIINTHTSVMTINSIVQLYSRDKNIDPDVVTQVVLGMGQIALLLGIEAGLITALLGLTSYTKIQEKKIDNQTTE